MFYTVLSRDGFCYIPTVSIVDEANIKTYHDAKLTKKQSITRELVAKLIEKGAVKFKFDTAQEALDFADAIYKKMPRYQRQLSYLTDIENTDVVHYTTKYRTMNSRGAGTWKSEVARKYR